MSAELYRIMQDADVWTWTSGDAEVVYNAETYTPEPIGRTEIEQGGDLARAALSVRVPRTNPLGLFSIQSPSDTRTSLTIFQPDDGDTWAAGWKGRLIGAQLTGAEIVLEFESVLTSARRMGLPARVTRSCNHAVYSRGCGLNRDDWHVAGTVTAINGYVLTVAAAAGEADGWYLGGMIEYDGALRWIVGHAGNQLTLLRPFRALAEDLADNGPVAVKIYPGCDRTKETCHTKFDNLPNRLGFDWLPERSPFNGSVL